MILNSEEAHYGEGQKPPDIGVTAPDYCGVATHRIANYAHGYYTSPLGSR